MEPEEEAEQALPMSEPSPRADFEAFMTDHYEYFLRLPMTIGATLDDAHDAVHDVIVKMLEKGTWERLTTNPRAWIRKAVLHTYYDQQKRQRVKGRIEQCLPMATEGLPDDGPNAWEDWQWVGQMLERLSPTQRATVELVLAEMDTSEIADLLGKTPGTVRQNLAHARKTLRANLGSDYHIGPNTPPAPDPRKEDTP